MQTKLVSLVITASIAAAAPAQTPVHEWRFEGNGLDTQSLAPGSVGQNITFTAHQVPAPIGQAMVVGINGTDPKHVVRVQQADVVGFGTGDFALAAWIRQTSSSGTNEGIADAQDASNQGWQLHVNSSREVQFRMDDGAGPDLVATSSSTISIFSGWHLIVVTVDRDDPLGAKIYINGVLDSEHDPTLVDGDINPSQNLWLGGMNDHNSQGLNGELGRFQIFLQDLSPTEIAGLYAADSAKHQYPMDNTGRDRLGQANGTVGENVVFDATGVPTQLGTAAVFTGDGDDIANRIDVPMDLFRAPGTEDFSFSCWVRRDNVTGTSDGLFDCYDSLSGIQTQFLGSNIVRARLVDTSGNAVSIETISTITDSQWHHLLFSVDRDQTNGARWYVDGVLDSVGDPTGVAGAIVPDQDLMIGTINFHEINGSIARLVFYNSALGADDAEYLSDLDGDRVPFLIDSCNDEDDNLDADNDGIADFCDICLGLDNIDSDGDGVCDSLDLCPGSDDSVDEDGDSVPDACDVCVGIDNIDSDGDGICDSLDACPGFDDFVDIDADGVADACDVCVGSDNVDSDGDGVCDSLDAFPGSDDALGTMPADVVCVWPLAPGDNSGSNWYNAYTDLRSAVDNAPFGSELWIASATYFPDGGTLTNGGVYAPGNGNRERSFEPNDLTLLGGFLGNESSSSGRDPDAHPAILSGDINYNGLPGGNAYQVVRLLDSDATLDGLTIRDGNDNGTTFFSGGGIIAVGGTLTVLDCVIRDNYAFGAGGGIHVQDCDTFIQDSAFIRNAVNPGSAPGFGGAIYAYSYSDGQVLDVRGCDFRSNSGALAGGAIYALAFAAGSGSISLTSIIDRCVFEENSLTSSTPVGGTAIYQGARGFDGWQAMGEMTVSNSTFVGNHFLSSLPGFEPAVIHNETEFIFTGTFESELHIVNCSIIGNTGPGVENDRGRASSPATLTIDNTVLWGNSEDEVIGDGTITVTHCIVDGGWSGAGVNNLNLDPMVAQPPSDGGNGWGDDPSTEGIDESANDDYGDLRLQPASPAIDSGDSSLVPAGLDLDLDENARFFDDPATVDTGFGPGAVVDRGAFEFGSMPPVCEGDANDDAVVDVNDVSYVIFRLGDPCAEPGCDGDANNDGVIDVNDISYVLFRLGNPC